MKCDYFFFSAKNVLSSLFFFRLIIFIRNMPMCGNDQLVISLFDHSSMKKYLVKNKISLSEAITLSQLFLQFYDEN